MPRVEQGGQGERGPQRQWDRAEKQSPPDRQCRPGLRDLRCRPGLLTLLALIVVVGVLPSGAATLSIGAPMEPSEPSRADHACRFWGMIGEGPLDSLVIDQLVEGAYSLKTLAASNPDGWGLGFRAPALQAAGLERPVLMRGGAPANHEWDDRFDVAVGEMVALDATQAVVHIRAASSGHTTVPDPHPFYRQNLLFAHNGTVLTQGLLGLLEQGSPGYLDERPPDYESPYIDSELYFLYVLKLIEEGRHTAAALREAILQIYDRGAIMTAGNCLLATPDTLFAIRFDPGDQDRYRVRYQKAAGRWIVASQPVGTDTTGWLSLPPKSMGIFTATSAPEIIALYPPPGPWLVFAGAKCDDDMIPPSMGNGNERIELGERIEYLPLLINEGTDSASLIAASLSTTDPFVQMISGLTTYADLDPGASGLPLQAFVFDVLPTAPMVHNWEFTLDLSAQEPGGQPVVWSRTFTEYAMGSQIVYVAHLIDDGGNGILEPGESADIAVWLENIGNANATNLVATLLTDSPFVEIEQGSAGIDTLQSRESGRLTPVYRIAVSPGCPLPELLSFDLALQADWGYTDTLTLELAVGGFNDPMEQGDGNWTHEAVLAGYGDAWHLSDHRNHTPEGFLAFKCGAVDSGAVYPNLLDAALISPEIILAEICELRFWHHIRAQLSMSGPGYAQDGGLVEASLNGGPWQQLYPLTGYDFLIKTDVPPGPFPEGTPVFSGFYGWRQAVCRIEGHSGTVRFRFRFGSDGNQGMLDALDGWYIDDVEILSYSFLSDVPVREQLPLQPALRIGGPSPFRQETTLLFDVVRAGPVTLSILDLEGRVVRHLLRGEMPGGRHRVIWDGTDGGGRPVPSGLYFYRLKSERDRFEDVRRIIRLR